MKPKFEPGDVAIYKYSQGEPIELSVYSGWKCLIVDRALLPTGIKDDYFAIRFNRDDIIPYGVHVDNLTLISKGDFK